MIFTSDNKNHCHSASRTDISHSQVTQMSVVIIMYICHTTFKIKTPWTFDPDGCYGPRYFMYAYMLVPEPGPRLNIKTVLSTYGDFHVKDKTAVRTSYL